jgi:imidazolonepropionase-like amidohydrolase
MSRNRRIAAGLVVGSALALLVAVAAQQPLPDLLVIDHVTIFDGRGGPVLKNGVIVIEGDRIRDIGRRGTIRGGKGVTILDASGKFAIPGLIDAHVHFDQSAGIFARPDAIDLRGIRSYDDEIAGVRQRLPETLLRYLRSGVTGVVDMGGPLWSLDFRDAANPDPAMTRIAAAGPLISTVAVPELGGADPPVILMETPDDARQIVKRIAERKPDLIKILFVHRPGDDLDRQTALVELVASESHRLGIRVAAHATTLATAKAAIGAGADVLVHSIDDRRIDSEFLGMLKIRNAIYIPTLLVTERYDGIFNSAVQLTGIERQLADPDVIKSWSELSRIPPENIPGGIPPATLLASRPVQFLNLQILSAADMRIAAGTDAGNIGTPHGPALHREMELMMEAGMRPFDILLAATRNAAAVMGRENEAGLLVKGRLADIVLLNADPVLDIRNTQKIFKVMKAGKWIETGLPQPLPGSRK